MANKKNVSGISDHKKRKGALVTPLNDGRLNFKFSSWAKERMPEYLWLGLILKYYGRKLGIEKAGSILFEISKSDISLPAPRLSMIFGLSDDDQKTIYKIISKHIEKDVLTPLTLIYKSKFQPLFNKYFFISHITVEERIRNLSEVVNVYFPHQSNEATDLRFLSLSFLLFNRKIVISTEAKGTIEALKEYPYTDHDDEKMRWYRPVIRSTEIAMIFEAYNTEFANKFWRELGMITPCNLIKIEFPENLTDYKEFTMDCRKVLEYIFYSNKEKSIMDDKFDVIVGSVNLCVENF